MDDFELEKFCEHNPDCGCKCLSCPAFAANYRYNNGLDSRFSSGICDYDDEDY